MVFRIFSGLAFLLFFNITNGQVSGCTDANANNYDPSATLNDGSCTYGNTNYSPAYHAPVPAAISETSGLMFWDGLLWTHNDSGGDAVLYGLDTASGTFVRSVRILEATNIDWEDISRDEEFAYIADFGNNNGTRTDLKIYKVSLADMYDDSASAEVISFTYPDQDDFSSRPQNHNFDAEALITFGDSLYIFSKNWANLRTKLYVLPKVEGSYSARLSDDIFAGGLITGADHNSQDSVIMLLGYTKLLQPYIWMLWDFNGGDVFGGNKRKVNLELPFHQTEGVAWWKDDQYMISNEDLATAGVAPALHVISTGSWISSIPTGINTPRSNKDVLKIFPNPVKSSVFISWEKGLPGKLLEIISSEGKVVFTFPLIRDQDSIQLEFNNLPAGIYNLVLHTASNVYSDTLIFLPEK